MPLFHYKAIALFSLNNEKWLIRNNLPSNISIGISFFQK